MVIPVKRCDRRRGGKCCNFAGVFGLGWAAMVLAPSVAGLFKHFRSFWGAWRTIAGYEAIHMIPQSQACWSAVGANVGLLHRFIVVCSDWKSDSFS
jgi:hypothetical protein